MEKEKLIASQEAYTPLATNEAGEEEACSNVQQ